jgi:hypothetical protein
MVFATMASTEQFDMGFYFEARRCASLELHMFMNREAVHNLRN